MTDIKLWSDQELRVAVNTYFYLVKLEESNIPYSDSEITKFLTKNFLLKRSRASVRYRLRNISHVMREKGLHVLKGYSPAPQVGSGVRDRIEKMIDSDMYSKLASSNNLRSFIRDEIDITIQNIEAKLDRLSLAFFELEKENIGIGHNGPPEPIEEIPFTKDEIRTIQHDIEIIRAELNSPVPDTKEIIKKNNILLQAGLKLTVWLGERITDFSKAAAEASGKTLGLAAGPALLISFSGLSPQIIDTARSLIKYAQHLLG